MSDLISRAEVVEHFQRLKEASETNGQYNEGFVDGLDYCISFISTLPSAEPKWIPCSERLPIDDDYRESMECLDGCVWYFTDKGLMGLGYYYYSTKEWATLRDLKPDGKVIAWTLLPKPYQEESENDDRQHRPD